MSDAQVSSDAVAVPPHPGERLLARIGGVEVLLVTNASPEAERQLAERLARRAMRDTPFHSPAFTTEDTGDTRIFIAREGGMGIGLAVLRARPRWAWWSWDDWDAERRPATGVAPMTSWTVETIWTHPSVQGRGLAKRLLDVASDLVDQPITSFGWHRPFTPSGEAFVRRWCPEGFWVPG
ncbi:MAG: hypothetical protein SF070_17035 [Gemmatimonadota bacterium]|nr:hypothetical protein [Gemmatimonadota bacterium]